MVGPAGPRGRAQQLSIAGREALPAGRARQAAAAVWGCDGGGLLWGLRVVVLLGSVGFFFNPFWSLQPCLYIGPRAPPAAEPMGRGGCLGAPGGVGRQRGRAPRWGLGLFGLTPPLLVFASDLLRARRSDPRGEPSPRPVVLRSPPLPCSPIGGVRAPPGGQEAAMDAGESRVLGAPTDGPGSVGPAVPQ